MKVNIYIGFWTLKVKCTQYGTCRQAAFKKLQGQYFFRSWARRGGVFSRVLQISWESCPCPDLTPLKVRRGLFNVYRVSVRGMLTLSLWTFRAATLGQSLTKNSQFFLNLTKNVVWLVQLQKRTKKNLVLAFLNAALSTKSILSVSQLQSPKSNIHVDFHLIKMQLIGLSFLKWNFQ